MVMSVSNALLEAVNRDIGVVADLGNILFVGEKPVHLSAVSHRLSTMCTSKITCSNTRQKSEMPGLVGRRTRDGNYLRDTIGGHGKINFEQVFRILRQAGYQGYYSLEYGGPEAAVNAIKDVALTICAVGDGS